MTRKKPTHMVLCGQYMKPQAYHIERVKTFQDKYGIECCKCPKCYEFIPNVETKARLEEIVLCPGCGLTFRLVKVK